MVFGSSWKILNPNKEQKLDWVQLELEEEKEVAQKGLTSPEKLYQKVKHIVLMFGPFYN